MSALLTSRLLNGAERNRLSRVDTKKLEKALSDGVDVFECDDFNESLATSPAPPPALFAWGQTACLGRPMIAIVGTRAASTYGKAVAQKFAETFARSGLVVASGGAMGIDTAAHEGALAAGGATVAVFANGVDVAQPPKNKPLFERIRDNGCLVSPFAIGSPAMEHKFAPRNHLIAAISLCVVVIEAPAGSGALMTCGAAADLGRDVFVVPGTIDMPGFRGSHRLVRDGATLVDDPAQVLEEIGYEHVVHAKQRARLNDLQQRIVDGLSSSPQSVEVISTGIKATGAEILAELTLLEMEGLVIKSAMGYSLKP